MQNMHYKPEEAVCKEGRGEREREREKGGSKREVDE